MRGRLGRMGTRAKAMATALATALAVAAAGCADDLDSGATSGDATSGLDATAGGKVAVTDLGGAWRVVVQATDKEAMVYVDLHDKDEVPATGGWELAIKRFQIASNGGSSGGGGAVVAWRDGVGFDDAGAAPETGWVIDAVDGSDDDSDPDLGFLQAGGWYAYDAATHQLSPRPRVYYLRSGDGATWKIAVEGYYDAVGTAGVITLRVQRQADGAPVGGGSDAGSSDAGSSDAGSSDGGTAGADALPAWPDALAWTAGSNGTFNAYRLSDGGMFEVGDLAASTAWDVALGGLTLRTNSGTSGPGVGGARPAGAAFDAVSTTDTVGFVVDAQIPIPGPPGAGTTSGNVLLTDWWSYNPATHTVAAKDSASYIVRSATGAYSKLQVVGSSGTTMWMRLGPVTAKAQVHLVEVDASASTAWTYVSLRDAKVVVVAEDAAKDSSWDLALQGVTMRTHSGSSGAGQGGAQALDAADVATVKALPGGGWVVDSEQPVPGPPGAGKVSANPALAGWYSYDPVAHVASPKPLVFAIRCADGSLAAIQVIAYSKGVYQLAARYAGPGVASFP